jgi:LacI family transcriptional regulator
VPTIHEVARKASVSVATVSYVLNDSGRVGEETKKRVLRAAKSLGFTPSLCARAMKGHRMRTMGMFVDGIAGPIYGETIEGAQEALKSEGWGLIVGTLNDPARELAATLAREHWLAGSIVLNGGLAPADLIKALAAKAPLIAMDAEEDLFSLAPKRGRIVRIKLDNERGMSAAAEHALERGVRSLVVLNGDERSPDARERSKAIAERVLAHGLAAVESVDCGFKAPRAYEAVKRLIASGARFDGLIAANDEMALGAMRALREARLGVPRDVIVVGFDDIEAAQWSDPSLSTVRVDRRALGALLAGTLMDMAGTERPRAETIVFPVEFIPRASTAREGSVK